MENALDKYHPYVIFMYYIYVGSLALFFNHPLFLSVALILMVLVNITHDKAHSLKQWMPSLLIMVVLFIVLNPLLISRGSTILFYLRDKQVTLEAVFYGVIMALSLVLILILFVSFNLVLNGNKFLYLFSKAIPRTAFLLMLSIRFIPLLKSRLQEINTVQRVRGMTLSQGKIKQRVTNAMLMIQILLTWSLEEAIQTADAMKARGYGTEKTTSYHLYRFKRIDSVVLIILTLLFTICIVGGLLGYGKIYIYPQLGTLHLYPLDWLLLLSLIMLIGFPIYAEGREQLKWIL